MTESIEYLSKDEANELFRLYKFFIQEADRCKEAKAYHAGSVMLGSALEAILVLFVDMYPEESLATGECHKRDKKILPLLKWDLSHLLSVAKSAGWLPNSLLKNPSPMW